MSAVATLKQWSAETAEAILAPLVEAGKTQQRKEQDSEAAQKRAQLTQFERSPKSLKAALATKAKAESDCVRAQAALDEAKRAHADAEGTVAQLQYEYSHTLKTLRRGAVPKYRTDAAVALLTERCDRMRASGITTAGDALKVLVQAVHAVTASASGDADPPSDDFEAWLSDVLARADAAFATAQRTADQQREARARDERARKLMS